MLKMKNISKGQSVKEHKLISWQGGGRVLSLQRQHFICSFLLPLLLAHFQGEFLFAGGATNDPRLEYDFFGISYFDLMKRGAVWEL